MGVSLLAAVLAAAPGPARAAEAVKLRPSAPVYADSKDGGLRKPEGVATDRKSLLVVADSGNGRVVKYTLGGETITPAGELALPELPDPIRVQVSSKGEILVLDGKLRRIGRVGPEGQFLGYIDLGSDAPTPVQPRSFAIDRDDHLYVVDVSSGRVLVLDGDGKASRKIAFPGEAVFVSDLTVDGSGTVYAIDSVGRRVYAAKKDDATFAPVGESLESELDFPTAIAADDRGHLFIADQNGGGIVILGRDGGFRGRQSSMGWKTGFLRYPAGLCVNDRGDLFVADRENSRIQPFVIVQ
jgi:sugar lactone lactonase YvrE